MTDLNKVSITFERTMPMMVIDRLPLSVADAPLEAVAEMKRHHIVTIEGPPDTILAVGHWMHRNVRSGEVERLSREWANDELINLGHSVYAGALDLDLPPKLYIVWRYGSDDDVVLLKMRWEGATQ